MRKWTQSGLKCTPIKILHHIHDCHVWMLLGNAMKWNVFFCQIFVTRHDNKWSFKLTFQYRVLTKMSTFLKRLMSCLETGTAKTQWPSLFLKQYRTRMSENLLHSTESQQIVKTLTFTIFSKTLFESLGNLY